MYKNISFVRQKFLDFFKKKGHEVISGSSLIPKDDLTLLFTNSGMNQFKNIFLGVEKPLFKRVVTIQKCMRAGGKHNDLENVGYTDRHLTFFEMLGNFSFGDYFKKDAIQFAWELLTGENWFNLSKDRIWVTTHVCDDESYNIWTKYIGISDDHIVKIGKKGNNFCDSDNFWQMGYCGPCGPCSEIFYDRGDKFQGSFTGDMKEIGERYIEIWNLVFMEFNRQQNGQLTILPILSVDTGMGLERITAILQGVHSNYDIDIFKNIIDSILKIVKVEKSISYRALYVIADHIRACIFLIKDGIIPSNENRGYVLRRIIRRAELHGKKLGINNIFLYKLVEPLIQNMLYIDDSLINQKDAIEEILFNEEKLFARTLQKGLEILKKELIKLKESKVLHGEVAFRLYDTYGFPIELTKDICYEYSVHVDQQTFDQSMLEQKRRSKKFSQFCIDFNNKLESTVTSKFVGYDLIACESEVVTLFKKSSRKLVDTIKSGEEGIVILDKTTFYGESGGQIGDSGYLQSKSGVFQVKNTKKYGQVIGHLGTVVCGSINVKEKILAEIDQLKRKKICLNHSVVHLLHMVLLQYLGSHITQCGSLINDKYLRFDFSHYKSITLKQLSVIENLVNQKIWDNLIIIDNIMSIEAARSKKAVMLPQKQYNKMVRVVNMGNIFFELCGGTHAKNTAEIGLFLITKEFGIGSGIRRIEAVSKNEALVAVQHNKKLLNNAIKIMHSDDEHFLDKICEMKLRYNRSEKELQCFRNKQYKQISLSLMKEISYIKNVQVLIKKIVNIESKILLSIMNDIKSKLKSGIIILVNYKQKNIIQILINVSKDLIENNRINFLALIKNIKQKFGGKGGGHSEFAQIIINDIVKETKILTEIYVLLTDIL